MRGRSMMAGLLAWIPAMDSDRPRLWRDCLTVREASESLVTKKSGHVSLTQLNPMEAIFLEIASMGCLLRLSVTMGSRCDTQFTHASFTRCPPSSTIHLELVYRGRAMTGLLWVWGMAVGKITRRDRREKKKNLPIFLSWLWSCWDERELKGLIWCHDGRKSNKRKRKQLNSKRLSEYCPYFLPIF